MAPANHHLRLAVRGAHWWFASSGRDRPTKLTLRFVLLVLVMLLSFGAGAAAGLQALAGLDDALTGVVEGDMQRLLAITHTRRLFHSMTVLERDYLLAASAEERAGVDKKMSSTASELIEQLDKYAALMHLENSGAVQSIRDVRSRWMDRDEKVRNAARAGRDAKPLVALHGADPVSWEAVIGLACSTGDGIVGIGTSGAIVVGECSAAAEQWFGKAKLGQQCAEYLFGNDSKGKLEFVMALDQLLEDVLPWELSVDQMPHRIARDGLLFDLDWCSNSSGQS